MKSITRKLTLVTSLAALVGVPLALVVACGEPQNAAPATGIVVESTNPSYEVVTNGKEVIGTYEGPITEFVGRKYYSVVHDVTNLRWPEKWLSQIRSADRQYMTFFVWGYTKTGYSIIDFVDGTNEPIIGFARSGEAITEANHRVIRSLPALNKEYDDSDGALSYESFVENQYKLNPAKEWTYNTSLL